MWCTGELVYRNYLPDKLEKGMLFMKILYSGSIKESIVLWTLDKLPDDENTYLSDNGAPIHLYIIDEDDEILAEPEEIGWFDLGEKFAVLTEISLKEINLILNDYDGILEIEIDEETFEEEDIYSPVLTYGKVTLRFLTDNDEDDDHESLNSWSIDVDEELD
jgi:hypothetical protein